MSAPWTLSRKPKCFASREAWRQWCSSGTGARSPCSDCSPEHRERMHGQKRCERPETVFVWSKAAGEIVGVTADSREFASLLSGPRGAHLPGWPLTDRLDEWARRLKVAQKRANWEVRNAIQAWLRKRGLA